MPIVGLHEYVPPDGAPDAVSVALSPVQRFVSGEAIVTVALLLMVNTIESTLVHPDILSVMLTLYVVVPATALVIVGFATLVLLRLVEGDQLYVKLPDPPVAVGEPPSVMVEPTGKQ